MILYFDSYITDKPLISSSKLKPTIRKGCKVYKKPKKIDIAKYSLLSYAIYPWSHVLIRYELEDANKVIEFDKFILSIFPKAIIFHERSDSQSDYRHSLEILERIKDPWIFYSPNNDHPLISYDKQIVKYINLLLEKAEKFRNKYKYTSIIYSHFSEFINVSKKGSSQYYVWGRETRVIEEDEFAISYVEPRGNFDSIQIVHKDILKQWFLSKDLGDRRIIRAEDVRNLVDIQNQLLISPKRELCAHFDGYEHLLGWPNEIIADKVPPLFIPKGFFNNAIKIAYGYDKYREGWININPTLKKYSFRDKIYGTDLKIDIEELPLFWKKHIKRIDKNNEADEEGLKEFSKKNFSLKLNPWMITKDTFLVDVRIYSRLIIYRIIIALGLKNMLIKIINNKL